LGSLVGSKDDISLFASNGRIFVRLNDESVSDEGRESINMGT
jgi:hypothetical protein